MNKNSRILVFGIALMALGIVMIEGLRFLGLLAILAGLGLAAFGTFSDDRL